MSQDMLEMLHPSKPFNFPAEVITQICSYFLESEVDLKNLAPEENALDLIEISGRWIWSTLRFNMPLFHHSQLNVLLVNRMWYAEAARILYGSKSFRFLYYDSTGEGFDEYRSFDIYTPKFDTVFKHARKIEILTHSDFEVCIDHLAEEKIFNLADEHQQVTVLSGNDDSGEWSINRITPVSKDLLQWGREGEQGTLRLQREGWKKAIMCLWLLEELPLGGDNGFQWHHCTAEEEEEIQGKSTLFSRESVDSMY